MEYLGPNHACLSRVLTEQRPGSTKEKNPKYNLGLRKNVRVNSSFLTHTLFATLQPRPTPGQKSDQIRCAIGPRSANARDVTAICSAPQLNEHRILNQLMQANVDIASIRRMVPNREPQGCARTPIGPLDPMGGTTHNINATQGLDGTFREPSTPKFSYNTGLGFSSS